MAANDSVSQQALARDPAFLARVKAQLIVQAYVVVNESGGTAHHPGRLQYAWRILDGANTDNEARRVAGFIALRPTIIAFQTSPGYTAVTSAAGDSDILTAIVADYNTLATIDPLSA